MNPVITIFAANLLTNYWWRHKREEYRQDRTRRIFFNKVFDPLLKTSKSYLWAVHEKAATCFLFFESSAELAAHLASFDAYSVVFMPLGGGRGGPGGRRTGCPQTVRFRAITEEPFEWLVQIFCGRCGVTRGKSLSHTRGVLHPRWLLRWPYWIHKKCHYSWTNGSIESKFLIWNFEMVCLGFNSAQGSLQEF
jgi:hypothetical protein